jgi:hypothetical protein
MAVLAAKLVCGDVGVQFNALMVPADTVGTQVALVAALTPMLVHVAVKPFTTWPGLTTVGVAAPNDALMSDALAVTVNVAVSHTLAFGAGAHTW